MPIICENSYLLNLRKNEMFSATLKKKKMQRQSLGLCFNSPVQGSGLQGFSSGSVTGSQKTSIPGSKKEPKKEFMFGFVFCFCFALCL